LEAAAAATSTWVGAAGAAAGVAGVADCLSDLVALTILAYTILYLYYLSSLCHKYIYYCIQRLDNAECIEDFSFITFFCIKIRAYKLIK
jgi:hypothetical protein